MGTKTRDRSSFRHKAVIQKNVVENEKEQNWARIKCNYIVQRHQWEAQQEDFVQKGFEFKGWIFTGRDAT